MRLRYKVFAITGALMALKLFAFGWVTAIDKAHLVSPAPVYAQGKPTAPEEVSGDEIKLTPGQAAGKRRIINRKNPTPVDPGLELLEDVKRRSAELDKREENVRKEEEQLKALKNDIDGQLSELKAMQVKIEEAVVLRNDLEKTAIRKLAKTYAGMPPASAGTLIQQIDKSIAIRVLSVMKERSAGKILAAIPAELATKLSEGLVKKR